MRSYDLTLQEAFAGHEGVRTAVRRAARIIAFAAFTAIGAQLAVRLPFTPIPVTVQTLFVVLAGMTLGPRDGFFSMLAYIGAGIAGAPVFAEFSFGPAILLGPTAGYLAAFPAAALAAGWLFERLGSGRPAAFASAAAGGTLILLMGAAHLALMAGLSPTQAFSLGILPFVVGDVMKSLAAGVLARGAARG